MFGKKQSFILIFSFRVAFPFNKWLLIAGELIGEEQFFIISAHNLLRREVGAKDLVCVLQS